MAISNHGVVFLAIFGMMLLPTAVVAVDHVVGDSSGWTTNFDYQAWAKGKFFYVNDNLVFNYPQGKHDVLIVNATSFANCSVPTSNDALTSGHDVVPLTASGKKWYICGVGRHCADLNQKLVINVEEGSAPSGGTRYGYQAVTAILVVLSMVAVG